MTNCFEYDIDKFITFIEYNETQFTTVTPRQRYNHMGATITDAILQAGLNYQNVVYPRVKNLLKKYSQYKTTCDFIILFQTIPIKELIDFNNLRKAETIKELSWFLYNKGINDEQNLFEWLSELDNAPDLQKIYGIGPKTVDYLKMLVGIEAIPIDRHLFSFVRLAGLSVNTYEEASTVYCQAAEAMNISRYELDKKIWEYMSNRRILKE